MFLVRLIGEIGFKVDAEFIKFENGGVELRACGYDPHTEKKTLGEIMFYAPMSSIILIQRLS